MDFDYEDFNKLTSAIHLWFKSSNYRLVTFQMPLIEINEKGVVRVTLMDRDKEAKIFSMSIVRLYSYMSYLGYEWKNGVWEKTSSE